MSRIVAEFFFILLLPSSVCAPQAPQVDESAQKPPAEQFQALVDENRTTRRELAAKLRTTESAAKRLQLQREYQMLPAKDARRFLELARKHPKDPAAVDALTWVATNVRAGKEMEEAYEILIRDHLESEQIAAIVPRLGRITARPAVELLRGVLAKHPNREVRGQAAFSLAQNLLMLSEIPAKMAKQSAAVQRRSQSIYGKEFIERMKTLDSEMLAAEAEELLERITKEFADIEFGRSTLGATAQGRLNALRYLAIGQVAPDIEGDDTDGKPMKLSDYRGKVVVLDFWGHW